ncbi:hypothetical protein AKO1_006382 [Acrasis kona]|uniref:Adenylate cyclase n=1 Tax=Acrasis kona TaxID=1008807 RepID=A0AAW2YJ19_9EUKA
MTLTDEEEVQLQENLDITSFDGEYKSTIFEPDESSIDSSLSITSVLKPNALDIIPCLLIILVTLVVVGVSIGIYFPLRMNEEKSLINDFTDLVAVDSNSLQLAILQVKSAIVFTTSLVTITKGEQGLALNEFEDFIHNENNRNDFIDNLYFISNVLKSQISTFPNYLMKKDPIGYANFSYRSDSPKNSPPDSCNGTYCLPVTLVASEFYSGRDGDLGWNHFSNPKRADLILRAIDARDNQAISSFLNEQGPPTSVVYVSAYDSYNKSILYGLTFAEVNNQKLIEISMSSLNRYNSSSGSYSLNVYEGASNNSIVSAMYSSKVFDLREMKRIEYNANSDKYVRIVQYGNLFWTCSFVPNDNFIRNYNGSAKYAGVISMMFVWIVCIVLCIILCIASRVYKVLKARQLTEKKIAYLSKFEPKKFLKIIRKRGTNTSLVLSYVELEGLTNVDKTMVSDMMSKFYINIKEITNNTQGYVHQCYNNGFLLFFTNVHGALGAAEAMKSIQSNNDVTIRVSIHHVDSALLSLVSDYDTSLQSIITSGLNVIESLSYFCRKYGKRVLLSQSVHDIMKKSHRKYLLFMGSLPVMSAQKHVRAYEVIEESERTESRHLLSEVMEYLYVRDYVNAAEILSQILNIDPTNIEAISLCAQIQLRLRSCKALSAQWTVPDTQERIMICGLTLKKLVPK